MLQKMGISSRIVGLMPWDEDKEFAREVVRSAMGTIPASDRPKGTIRLTTKAARQLGEAQG